MKTELSVNMSLQGLLWSMTANNAVDGVKILKVVYGISYSKIADIFGVPNTSISLSVRHGSFDGIVSGDKLEQGLSRLRALYLGRY